MLENHQPDNPFTFLLEENKRISDSLLWQAQRNYFELAGINAWRSGEVPHQITSNPRMASSYAEIVLGFFRDLCATKGLMDPAVPLYIVELGAGSGRFGFLFLKIFSELLPASSLPPVSFRYVMTDFVASNLEFLRSHQALRPFIENGLLDFALFDMEHGEQLKLQISGKTLSQGSLLNPLVVVANYVFDGVRHDAFLVKDGALMERLISVYSNVATPDLTAPGIFEHLAVTYSERPAPQDPYPEPEFNAILGSYLGSMKEATILFPLAALQCIRRLAGLSGGRLLLLTSDKGEIHRDLLEAVAQLDFVVHGSFSVSVNYHAIAEWTTQQGGEALMIDHRHADLKSSAFLLGMPSGTVRETRLAYDRVLGSGTTNDFFVLRHSLQERCDNLELKELLALLRLSGHDPRVMEYWLPTISAQLENAEDGIRKELARTAQQVWANYYHLGEEYDLAFNLGCLLYGLREYQKSLQMFQESCCLYGRDSNTLWNMGVCYSALKRTVEAAECLSEALNSEEPR